MFTNPQRFEKHIPIKVGNELCSMDTRLRIFQDDKIEVWYSPVGERVHDPQVWILGITPGWKQMKIAFECAAEHLRHGATQAEAASAEKPTVAFAGTMRINLILMLDDLGLAKHMNVESTAKLFGSSCLRTGSVLKYPVFKNGQNYSGSSPDPLRHQVLRNMIDVVLVDEIKAVNKCLIIPLGTAVEKVLEHCVSQKYIDRNRILSGFPHPSGANGYRLRHFNERRTSMQAQLSHWFK